MPNRFRTRRWAVARALLATMACVSLLGACGSDGDGDAAPATTQPSIAFPSTLSTSPPVLSDYDPAKAAPRWEQVRVVTGNSPMDLGTISIAEGAIQWRVKWSCETGAMRITSAPPPVPTRPSPVLVESDCPGQGEGFGRQTGEVRMNVDASGPWKATVEQQVDTPLDEPPLPEMANARVLGRGDIYNVEKTGKGTAILYELPDGRRALRFENGFEVLNDPDLVVWLSEATNPQTSKEVVDSGHVEIAALRSTKGSQNYIVPADLPLSRIGSVALYCVPVPSIYIAASLS